MVDGYARIKQKNTRESNLLIVGIAHEKYIDRLHTGGLSVTIATVTIITVTTASDDDMYNKFMKKYNTKPY